MSVGGVIGKINIYETMENATSYETLVGQKYSGVKDVQKWHVE